MLPEGLTFSMLDRDARERLRSLTKENAEFVGLHLIAAGEYLDMDPELSYQHAQSALRRGGRVDIVREAVGLAAYRTERYAEALRELRTVRRLNGSSEHLPIMADCERGLGRPDRAVALAASEEAATLRTPQAVELAIVVSGARGDLGEFEAGLAALDAVPEPKRDKDLALRLVQARITLLERAGRDDEAAAIAVRYSAAELGQLSGAVADDVVVYEYEDDDDHDADEISADETQADRQDSEDPDE